MAFLVAAAIAVGLLAAGWGLALEPTRSLPALWRAVADRLVEYRYQHLGAVALLDEPRRRRLYDYVSASDHAVGRDEAAAATDISRELAAFHLDRLARAGLLDTTVTDIEELFGVASHYGVDFADVKGQESVKRALTIAAAWR